MKLWWGVTVVPVKMGLEMIYGNKSSKNATFVEVGFL
jgi:hypothetical protein